MCERLKMTPLFVFICVWTVVFAEPYTKRYPVPVNGLLSQVFSEVGPKSAAVIKSINELQQKNGKNLIKFFRQTGGPGFEDIAKYNYFVKQATEFWKFVTNSATDLTASLRLGFDKALTLIKKQFRLVFDRPEVRGWLREFESISRSSTTKALAVVQRSKAQWRQLVFSTVTQGREVISELCENRDSVQDRFDRIVRIYLAEYVDIINQLVRETITITANIAKRVFELARKIYDVEVEALEYYIS